MGGDHLSAMACAESTLSALAHIERSRHAWPSPTGRRRAQILVAVKLLSGASIVNDLRRGLWSVVSGKVAPPPVAQRIEQWFPKPCAQVRLLPGGPYRTSGM